MSYYSRSVVIQSGRNAICIAESSFENRKYDYTVGFYLNEKVRSESICHSLSYLTAFRGVYIEDHIAQSFLELDSPTTFEQFDSYLATSLNNSIEILKCYEDNLKSKNMVFFKVTKGKDIVYGGYIKEKSLYRPIDVNEVLLNIDNDNAFILPSGIGATIEQQ